MASSRPKPPLSRAWFYPTWDVSRWIPVNELLPKIRRNPTSGLESLNLQLVTGKGQIVDPATVDWSTKDFRSHPRQ